MSLNLVTGATGFIGSHVTRLLLERGDKVRVFVRNPGKLPDVGLSATRNLEVCQGDLLEPEMIGRALEGVDCLYHIAGYVSTAAGDAQRIWDLNYHITRNLLEACRRMPLQRITYLGSIFALGGGGPDSVTETVGYNLDRYDIDYFKAKRQAEIFVRTCLTDGLPVVCVYPSFCYGPGDVHCSSSRLLLAFLRQEIPAYVRGGQNAMDVRDAAAGIILAMEKGVVGERYLVGGANCTYKEIFGILSELTGYPPPRLPLSPTVGRAVGRILQALVQHPVLDEAAAGIMGSYWYYDDSKARKNLGHTSRPLRETFGAAIDWLCGRGLAPWPPRFSRA